MKRTRLRAQYDILVIGFGIAGLAAARSLASKYPDGIRILIVEASSTPGGRVVSDKLLSHSVDTGAAWIHGGITTGENPTLSLLVNPAPRYFVSKQDNNFFSKLNPWTMAPPISTLFCTRGGGTVCMSVFQTIWNEMMKDLAALALHVTVHYSPDVMEKSSLVVKENKAGHEFRSPLMSGGALLCALLKHKKYAALSPQEIELLLWRFWNYGCWQADTLFRIPSYEFECAPPLLKLSDLYGPMPDPVLHTYIQRVPEETSEGVMKNCATANPSPASSSCADDNAVEVEKMENHVDADAMADVQPPHFPVGDYSGFHGLPQPARVCLPTDQRLSTRYRCRLRKQHTFRHAKRRVYVGQKEKGCLYVASLRSGRAPKVWVLALCRKITLSTHWEEWDAAMPQLVHTLVRDCGMSPQSPGLEGGKKAAAEVHLALNCKVHAIDWQASDGVRVFCQMSRRKGSNKKPVNLVFHAKHVICTIPTPALRLQMRNGIEMVHDRDEQLISFRPVSSPKVKSKSKSKSKLESKLESTSSLRTLRTKRAITRSLSRKITYQSFFHPELPPTKVDALGKIYMGKYKKVFLLYERQWWPDTWSTFIPISDPVSLSAGDDDNARIETIKRAGWKHPITVKRRSPTFHLIENYAKMKNTAGGVFPCLVGILVGDEVYAHDVYTFSYPTATKETSETTVSNASAASLCLSAPEVVLRKALHPYASLLRPSHPKQTGMDTVHSPLPHSAPETIPETTSETTPDEFQVTLPTDPLDCDVADSAPALVREAVRLQLRYDVCNAVLAKANNAFDTLASRYDTLHSRPKKLKEPMERCGRFVIRKRLFSDAECVQGMKRTLRRICNPETQSIRLQYDCSCGASQYGTKDKAKIIENGGEEDDGSSGGGDGKDHIRIPGCMDCTATNASFFPPNFVPPEPIATLCTGWERNENVGFGAYPHSDPSLEEDDIQALQQPIVVPKCEDARMKGIHSLSTVGDTGAGGEEGASTIPQGLGFVKSNSLGYARRGWRIRGGRRWAGISLHFAGDCTESMHMGSVHGAYMSGLRAAEEIIALHD